MILPMRLTTATVGDPAARRPSRSRCTLGTGEGRGKRPASRRCPHRTVATGLVVSGPEFRGHTGATVLPNMARCFPIDRTSVRGPLLQWWTPSALRNTGRGITGWTQAKLTCLHTRITNILRDATHKAATRQAGDYDRAAMLRGARSLLDTQDAGGGRTNRTCRGVLPDAAAGLRALPAVFSAARARPP